MPAKSAQAQQEILQELLHQHLTAIQAADPSIGEKLHKIITSISLNSSTVVHSKPTTLETELATNSPQPSTLEERISMEEHSAVLQKLAEIVSLPQQLSEENQLYLEQQVSDLLGFSVTARIGEYELPHTVVTVSASMGWKTLSNSAASKSNKKRSFYGWFERPGAESNSLKDVAQYGVALPLSLTTAWQRDPIATAEWFKFRQVVVLNPLEKKAVICAIADLFSKPVTQYQAEASQAVIQEGRIWSYTAQGKAVLFFVDMPNPLKLGVLDISWAGK